LNFNYSSLVRISTFGLRVFLVACGLVAARIPAACAVTIKIDYEFDTNFFFSSGNPGGANAGAQAKSAIEAAAAYLSGIVQDTLAAVQIPAPFTSQAGSNVAWHWRMDFAHPVTNLEASKVDDLLPANEFRIYVGARSLEGNALAVGSIGTPYAYGEGNVVPADNNTANQILADFRNLAHNRGEASTDAVSWGGAISFDRDADTVWNYGLAGPLSGANDFYAVALHEMVHALGFGTSDEWKLLAAGDNFTGSAAGVAYGSPPPLHPPSGQETAPSHWYTGTMSHIYGTNIAQEVAMDPELVTGTRKHLTALDAAALVDLGWEVAPPAATPADFNRDGYVDAADFSAWKTAFGATAAGSADGDADSDGVDFLAWQRTRGASAFPAAAAIPEPGGFSLLGWTLVVGLRASRSKRALLARHPHGDYAASSGRV
jgi:hypothetical protein